MKKLILILLLATAVGYGQTWTVKSLTYTAIAGVSFQGSDIDSSDLASGTRSTEIDWSVMGTGGNTIYFAMALDGNGALDTVQVWVQGKDPLTGNWVSIDTLSAALISTAAGTTMTTGTLSISSYFPTIAVYLSQKSANTDPSDDEIFYLTMFTVPPNILERSYWK